MKIINQQIKILNKGTEIMQKNHMEILKLKNIVTKQKI